MNKKLGIIFLLILLFIMTNCKRYSRGGKFKSVGAAGNVLGNAVVNIIKDIRGEAKPVPKGFKRQYQKPQKEEHTVKYKIMNGLRNFIYLGYGLLYAFIMMIIWKIYQIIARELKRSKLSMLPPDAQREIVQNLILEYTQSKKQIDEFQKYDAIRKKNEQKWKKREKQNLKRAKMLQEVKMVKQSPRNYVTNDNY